MIVPFGVETAGQRLSTIDYRAGSYFCHRISLAIQIRDVSSLLDIALHTSSLNVIFYLYKRIL